RYSDKHDCPFFSKHLVMLFLCLVYISFYIRGVALDCPIVMLSFGSWSNRTWTIATKGYY
ncbi:hypothetical protein TorRG33x02_308180, partial [Trema orientale]